MTQKYQKVHDIIRSFKEENTDLDLALYLFSSAVAILEALQKEIPEDNDPDQDNKGTHELQSRWQRDLIYAKDLLSLANSKFHQQNLPLGEQLTSRYLKLIANLLDASIETLTL